MGKYAYFSGVNLFTDGNNLRGCVNDVVDIRERLVAKYKVNPDNIRMLTDYRATAKVELEHWDWIIGCCDPVEKDVLIIQNSSHGTNFRIRRNGVLDNYVSDVICPSDFDWDNNFISADMIHDKLQKVPPNTTVIFISDSCCSGNLVKRLSQKDSVPKRMLPPEDILNRSIGQELQTKTIQSYVSIIDSVNVIFLSGCQSNQTSADAYIDGRYNGALTAALKDVIDRMPEVNWHTCHEEIHKYLTDGDYDQEPELKTSERNLTKLIFEE